MSKLGSTIFAFLMLSLFAFLYFDLNFSASSLESGANLSEVEDNTLVRVEGIAEEIDNSARISRFKVSGFNIRAEGIEVQKDSSMIWTGRKASYLNSTWIELLRVQDD